jgi:hypothetical protein
MYKHIIVVSASALAVLAVKCGGSTTVSPHTPKVHRAAAMMCDNTRPPGITDAGAPMDSGLPDSGIPGQCNQDSDCTQGNNGRCSFNRIGKVCTYDTCTTDAECANGGVCMCREGASSGTNHCVGGVGGCRVDADCGPNGACSPSFGSCGNYGGTEGYYCHTSSDTCVDDSECTEGGTMGYCMFETKMKKWQCSYSFCAG